MTGRRPRGSQRLRWVDGVANDVKLLAVRNWWNARQETRIIGQKLLRKAMAVLPMVTDVIVKQLCVT